MSSVSEQPTGIIVKTDHSGRIRYTSQYKQEVIAAFETSSLSAPDFARKCGIKYPTCLPALKVAREAASLTPANWLADRASKAARKSA